MAELAQALGEIAGVELGARPHRELAAGDQDAESVIHRMAFRAGERTAYYTAPRLPPVTMPLSCHPDLACVVLALGNPPELAAAVRSLLDQGEPLEVVVVNSAGGGAAATLAAAGLAVPVVERPERLLPGAARNLGIAATRAPFVAFLAAD